MLSTVQFLIVLYIFHEGYPLLYRCPRSLRNLSLDRKSDDIGWNVGVLVDPINLDLVKCKRCGKEVRGSIYRLSNMCLGLAPWLKSARMLQRKRDHDKDVRKNVKSGQGSTAVDDATEELGVGGSVQPRIYLIEVYFLMKLLRMGSSLPLKPFIMLMADEDKQSKVINVEFHKFKKQEVFFGGNKCSETWMQGHQIQFAVLESIKETLY
ncbi:hypothetical protein ACP70R_021493 [Stipagrostis hirtigluma subsp. patula]